MPKPTEEQQAGLAKTRGVTAAHIKDPAERRAYIEKQGKMTSSGSDADIEKNYNQLQEEDANERNQLAVQGDMHTGGPVHKSGLYKLEKGEHVIPKDGVHIHIKPSHEGLMARDVGKKAGAPMTEADIQKEKHSSDPAERKRGTFAENAKHWHHGG